MTAGVDLLFAGGALVVSVAALAASPAARAVVAETFRRPSKVSRLAKPGSQPRALMAESVGQDATVLSPMFKLSFFTVLGLTILSLVVSFVLTARANPTDAAKQLAETCSTTWKMGFGAIVGLIGGKTT